MGFAIGLLIKLLLRWGVPQRFAGIAADAIVVLLIGGAVWGVHSHIWNAGYDARKAEDDAAQQAAQAEAQADSLEIVDAFSIQDAEAQAALVSTKAAEIRYVEKIIRTAVEFTRDNPSCRFPDRVWRESDEYADELARASGLGIIEVRPALEDGRRRPGNGGSAK